jgi:gas vesicle protein
MLEFIFGSLVKKSERAAQRVIKSASKEVNDTVNLLFDELLDPLVDKLDYITKKRLNQVSKVSEKTIDTVSKLKDELKADIEALLQDVDQTYKDILRQTFEEINQARAEAIYELRKNIGEATQEIDNSLEERINQISKLIMETLKQSQIISDKFAPEEIREQLTKPTLEQVVAIEEKLFIDAERIINQIDEIVSGTLEEIRNLLKSLVQHTLPNPLDKCRQRLNIAWKSGLSLSDIEIYELTQCIELSKLNVNLPIEEVIKIYSQLELNAARMTALARNTTELRKKAIQDWLNYGMLCEFWRNTITDYDFKEPLMLPQKQQKFLTGRSDRKKLFFIRIIY